MDIQGDYEQDPSKCARKKRFQALEKNGKRQNKHDDMHEKTVLSG